MILTAPTTRTTGIHVPTPTRSDARIALGAISGPAVAAPARTGRRLRTDGVVQLAASDCGRCGTDYTVLTWDYQLGLIDIRVTPGCRSGEGTLTDDPDEASSYLLGLRATYRAATQALTSEAATMLVAIAEARSAAT